MDDIYKNIEEYNSGKKYRSYLILRLLICLVMRNVAQQGPNYLLEVEN